MTIKSKFVGDLITQERPSGTVNGSNKVFTLTDSPLAPDCIMLFKVVSGVWTGLEYSTDYTVLHNRITMVTAPASGYLFAWYPSHTTGAYPANLTAVADGDSIELDWDAFTGAASYNIKRSTSHGGPYSTIDTSGTNSYDDVTAVPGVTYYYVISAVYGNAHETPNSDEASDNIFSPADVATSMAAWHDASDLSTFTFSSSNVIAEWRDKSGNGNHLAQATTAKQPTRLTGVLGGKAVVDFDGINDFLDWANDLSPLIGEDYTLLVVIRWQPGDSSGRAIHIRDAADTDYLLFASDPSALETVAIQSRQNGVDQYGTANAYRLIVQAYGTWRLFDIEMDSTPETYANGTLADLGGTTLFGRGSATNSRLGARAGDEAAPMLGQVAELILYTGIISGSDRTKLETYFAAKYGLSIP